jgi:phage FluMu protein Com
MANHKMKPAAPRITPDEGHVIKATAWDAMRVAFSIHAETADGNKYSNAKTWGAIMPRKYNDELLCRCVACGTVTAKADWKHYIGVVFICPNCGCLQDPSIGNEQPPEVPELKTYADPEPTPPKSASAKPAAKK